MSRALHSGFLRSAEKFGDRPALEVAGTTLTYAGLRDRAAAIAATLTAASPAGEPLTGVFAYRTPTAFAGLLGALLRGHGYVPLNRTLPPRRTRSMLERSGAGAVVADAESAAQLPEVLAGIERELLVLLPDAADVGELAAALPGHRVLGAGDLAPAACWEPPPVDADAVAYLLFTSGSTGVPKGVMVAHSNVFNYVDALAERYAVTESDRFSQTHDLTFDNSVFDMFVPWERGACVCCPDAQTLIKPGGFIRDSRLTVWFSVPSTAGFMRRLGTLKPGSYESLRWSLFAGEALPVELAQAWQDAAPNSTLENLYGPTEATVDVTVYRFDPATTPAEAEAGVVPIGYPLPNIETLIVDSELREVEPGAAGELLVSGPQVALGYWRDPERTAESFVVPPGRQARHYRTGDRVRRPRGEGPIRYLGRIDDQIKIRGVRVELGEIEAALRDETGVDAVAAVGWPRTISGADGIEAFIADPAVDAKALKARLEARLPGHMVPRKLHLLDELPLNANGKIDRPALLERLKPA